MNERTSKSSLKLKGTERIEITGRVQPEPLKAIAEDIPLEIIFEDKDLAVVNKPAGMMVHAGAGASDDERNRGTLVNALLFRFNKLSEVGGELRPGIVHRLDKEVSGVLLFARSETAMNKIKDTWKETEKHYYAFVEGTPGKPEGTIQSWLIEDKSQKVHSTFERPEAKFAVTHYKVLKTVNDNALLDIRTETGRKNQIRDEPQAMAQWGPPLRPPLPGLRGSKRRPGLWP